MAKQGISIRVTKENATIVMTVLFQRVPNGGHLLQRVVMVSVPPSKKDRPGAYIGILQPQQPGRKSGTGWRRGTAAGPGPDPAAAGT